MLSVVVCMIPCCLGICAMAGQSVSSDLEVRHHDKCPLIAPYKPRYVKLETASTDLRQESENASSRYHPDRLMLRSYPRCFYASIMPCAQQKLTARVVFIHHLVPCTKLTPHRMSISRFDAERAELINISQDSTNPTFASLRAASAGILPVVMTYIRNLITSCILCFLSHPWF